MYGNVTVVLRKLPSNPMALWRLHDIVYDTTYDAGMDDDDVDELNKFRDWLMSYYKHIWYQKYLADKYMYRKLLI
jgi:hypothetical protein